jgi:hypothetical protein
MTARIRLTVALAATFALFGCSAEKSGVSSAGPSATKPGVTLSAASVVADGANTVTVTVTGTAPLSLTATRGAFVSTGTGSAQLASSGASVDLRTCNARTATNCAGQAVVTATGADGGQTQVAVTFQGFENCSNGVDDNGNGLVDCADPDCPLDSACGANGLVCSSTHQCNKCTVAGGGAVEPSGEVSCADGFDNDCDGAIDCADSQCDGQRCTMATGRPGTCTSGACVCAGTEARETTCGDGKDNDCDGLIDCQDPDCLGKVCDGTGKVCPGPAPSTCGVCLTGTTETNCSDGKDNDCDGLVDCFDPDCQPSTGPGALCNPFGGRCLLTSGIPSCGCPGGATTETACSGGVDDDCDGKTDCADEDCQPLASGAPGAACDANGRACTSQGVCACASNTEICNNYDANGLPVDDDCDGRANCADPDCRPATPGAAGKDCSAPGQFGMACDATGTCACTGNGAAPEAREISCGDGIDNDCDFLVDCEDPDCGGRSCGPSGAVCNATTHACECPGGTTESSCTDGIDNNCNGKIDCEEPACAGLACNVALPGYLCISQACADPASEYAVVLTPARSRIPANGKAETAVDVFVTHKGVAKSGVSLGFSVSPALGTISPATPVTTNAQGRAQVTFTSGGPIGVATITATVTGVGAKGTTTVTMPAIGEVRLSTGGILYSVMGVRTSGFQEQNQLTVEVVDAEQRPYPDGLEVTFEHRPLGGSALSDPLPIGSTTCAASPCVQSSVVLGSGGLASVRLYSGTVAGIVRVSASAAAGGFARQFELPTIPIVGAKPNAGHFALVCGPQNVPALADTTCHVSLVDAPFTCVALLKDRYNNLLGRATDVTFMSEAGAAGPPGTTPEYDPAKGAELQGDLGSALGIIETLGGKLPKDVSPVGLEPSIAAGADACGVSVRNPRDGLVTVIAWTPGEESFFDTNGNGVYDLGEPFIDLPEPFVDYNDNDVRDADEPFIDADGNGTFTVANGVWDSNTSIWTRTVVVYTGAPAYLSAGGNEYASRWMEAADVATYPGPTPTASFSVRPSFPPDPFFDCNENTLRDASLMEPFTDATTGTPGVYDLGEVFKDCNGNGVWNAVSSEPYVDVNGNGVYDASTSPATSETLYVAASDRNLNRLVAATTYSVSKPTGSKFSISLNGPSKINDGTGFDFNYQPCLASSPGTCALDCADVTSPGNMRCTMRTRISGFGGTYRSSVTITGGPVDGADGLTEAFFTMDMPFGTLTIPVFGTSQ